MTKYDKQKTEKHKRESMFEILGYHEELRCKGKQIAEIRHDYIPWGCDLGHLGGGVFDVKKPTEFNLRGQKTVICPGVLISRSIIPLCGRLKTK